MVLDLGYKQATLCNNDSFTYINCLVKNEGMRSTIVMVYNVLVSTKRIPKIENLTFDGKTALWEQTKEFAKDNLNLQETIRLSKCLYALEYLIS